LFADIGHGSPFLAGAIIVALAFLLALNLFGGFGAAPLAEPEQPLGPAG
jgi:hypothetical protein